MKKIATTILCSWALIISVNAQDQVALENKPHTLQDRYYLMKTHSETYQDYKVIKEYILDGFWKIVIDSLKKQNGQLTNDHLKIDSVKKEIAVARAALKSKTDSLADIEFAAIHINAFGKDFSKTSFLILVSLLFIFLASSIVVILARMNEMQKFVNESKLIVTSISNEFEEYKHKTLEKQIKLARELQTERNKLLELRTQKSQ